MADSKGSSVSWSHLLWKGYYSQVLFLVHWVDNTCDKQVVKTIVTYLPNKILTITTTAFCRADFLLPDSSSSGWILNTGKAEPMRVGASPAAAVVADVLVLAVGGLHVCARVTRRSNTALWWNIHVDNKTIESIFQILLKVPSEQSGAVSLKGLKQLLDWIFVKELRNKLFCLAHDYIDGPWCKWFGMR